MGGVDIFLERVDIFSRGVAIFLGGVDRPGYFKGVEKFSDGVFSFSCRLRFSFSLIAGGGGRLIFFQKLKVSHGIKIFPVT